MEFKDYYATLGVAKTATDAQIKQAYRKLARKYHPDLSKEKNAESRFKEVAEAYEALHDVEKRAAYDRYGTLRDQQPGPHPRGQPGTSHTPPPGWDSGFEYRGRGGYDDATAGSTYDPTEAEAEAAAHSDFFESLFGRQSAGTSGRPPPRGRRAHAGEDHHAKVEIDLQDAYLGARRMVSLQAAQVDAQGRVSLHTRQLEINIPKGVRGGQHLRLSGQGGAGTTDITADGAPTGAPAVAGDLYLEIHFTAHPLFRIDDRDVYIDVPLAPWEAALGASVTVPTPAGEVQVSVPVGSAIGRRLRLKGKGIPANPPGDFYVVLGLALPAADTAERKAAYAQLAAASADFDPRAALVTPRKEPR